MRTSSRSAPAAPVTTSNVSRVPTDADMRMVEAATNYFAGKLVAALSRNRNTEHNLVRSVQSATEEYTSAMSALAGADDNLYRLLMNRVRAAHTALTSSATEVNTYLNNSIAAPSAGRAGSRPDYLSIEFIRETLKTLCSSYEGFRWDDSAKELTVQTEAITLSHQINGTQYVVPLGRFRIVWGALAFNGANGTPGQFKIFAVDEGHHAHNNPQVIHPHVSSNNMCPGNAATGVAASLPAAMNGGRLADCFDLIDGLLHNYGGSPFVRLEVWGNHLCPGCSASVPRSTMVTCFQCNAGHCRTCSNQCPDCNRWYCKERCGTLDRATRTYTCPCNLNTVRCNGCRLRFDPSTPMGNMDPVHGYCPHCLYLWTTGTTPTPSTARQASAPMPRTPSQTRPPLAPALTPVPRAPTPAPSNPPVPIPAQQTRSRRGQFDGNFDDILDAEARIVQSRLEAGAATPLPTPPTPPANQEAADLAQGMLDDIEGISNELPAMQPDAEIPLPAANVEPESPAALIARVIDAQAPEPGILVSPPMQNPAAEVFLTQDSALEPITPTARASNPNRYRHSVTGRWVTRE